MPVDPWTGQRFFEDVHLGDEFDEAQEASPERIQAFYASARYRGGSPLPRDERFTSVEGARRAGLEGPIVPGPMSAAMITRLVSDWMGAFGRIVSIDLSFRRPVLHGHRLRSVAIVTDMASDEMDTSAPGVVSLDVHLENELGERPVQGTAEVELPRRWLRRL